MEQISPRTLTCTRTPLVCGNFQLSPVVSQFDNSSLVSALMVFNCIMLFWFAVGGGLRSRWRYKLFAKSSLAIHSTQSTSARSTQSAFGCPLPQRIQSPPPVVSFQRTAARRSQLSRIHFSAIHLKRIWGFHAFERKQFAFHALERLSSIPSTLAAWNLVCAMSFWFGLVFTKSTLANHSHKTGCAARVLRRLAFEPFAVRYGLSRQWLSRCLFCKPCRRKGVRCF